ncbi:MAG: hypothetical protein ACP5JO_03460 [Candidatus Ratteibacteria bacterium]
MQKNGIPCGLVATCSQINQRIEEGFQFIAVGHNISLLTNACRKTLSEIK